MIQVIKSYKFRIYPNNEQKETIENTFTACRFVYNQVLQYYNEKYKKTRKNPTREQCINKAIKIKEKYTWLQTIDPIAIQSAAANVKTSHLIYYRTKKHPPHFKSKHNPRKSYTTRNTIEIIKVDKEKNIIYLPQLKWIKAKIDRKITGKILNATISNWGDNKYYVSITIKTTKTPLKKTQKAIGIDLGIKDLIITSTGQKIPNLALDTKYHKKLKKERKKLYKKQKHSKNWEKQRIKISKIHKHIHNKKIDYYHKITKKLVTDYDIIAVETLNIKKMIREPSFSKKIQEAAWAEIIRQLEYKCEWYGKQLIKINPYYPSSKLCSVCGYKYNNLQLNEREWTCPKCHTTHDRDINAAKNILNEALRRKQ
ncbi:MAG: transposase [Methanosphaera stadtmanae]|nr:transposase [Methanosphaera stadtmanae]